MTGSPPNKWDERYDHERFFYGEKPNYFVARKLVGLPPGRALFLAEGEGRNAVYAAGLGHQVTAVDTSAVGRRKALQLAAARGVELEYRLGDVTEDRWSDEPWDLIVLCFCHLPPPEMSGLHAMCAAALGPGGTLLLNSFSKKQFGRPSGGPPRLEWLHDPDVLRGQFPGLEVGVHEKEVVLDEGTGHRGAAMVIELIGAKVR